MLMRPGTAMRPFHALRSAVRASSCATPATGSRLAALREALQEDDGASRLPARKRKEHVRHPDWLKAPMAGGDDYQRIKKNLKASNLATVCQEARCPNIGECWGGKEGTATATIMVMGDTCTRGCRFCNVKTSRNPAPLMENEAEEVGRNIASWGVGYVVITSVDRDDITDGGAGHFAAVVRKAKELNPKLLLECLTPDFNGTSGLEGVATVATSGLDVYAHNIETVERLQRTVRDHRAGYRESFAVLEHAKRVQPSLVTKTSIMLGCGEEEVEVRQTMRDALSAGVEIFTLGQYLRPSKKHMPVSRLVHPDEFEAHRLAGLEMGFKYVASGPLVRSSYKAGEAFIEGFLKQRDAAAAAALEALHKPAPIEGVHSPQAATA